MPEKPMNILVLHTDQQRWDSLGCNGNPAAQTPNIDRLAATGVRYEHHYSSNPVCMPSRASLFTGRHVAAHGVLDNGVPLNPASVTLPQVLGQAGYDTLSVGKLHFTPYLSPAESQYGESFAAWNTGVLDGWDGPYYGFEKVDLVLCHGEMPVHPRYGHYGHWLAKNHPEAFDLIGEKHAPEPTFPMAYRSQIPIEAHNTTYIADRIIEQLRQRDGSKPFFIFGGFPDPHHPFVPPQALAERFDGVEFPRPHVREGEHEGRPAHYGELYAGKPYSTGGGARRAYDGELMHNIVQNTYAMVSMIDDSVGRIMDELDRLGLADDTIVIFTSDHGELLGDHGLLYKGPLPFASLMRVPFVIRVPGAEPRMVDAPMSNTDVMPTLLELVGVAIPDCVQGRSHAPFLRGEADRIEDEVFSSGWLVDVPRLRHMSLHSDTYRITWWPNQVDGELYDLRNDPHEFENLFHREEHRAWRDQLMTRLLRASVEAGPIDPQIICDW